MQGHGSYPTIPLGRSITATPEGIHHTNMGQWRIYASSIVHSPNGHFVNVVGIYTTLQRGRGEARRTFGMVRTCQAGREVGN